MTTCFNVETWNYVRASKDDKASWANEAAALIESMPPRNDDIWAFVDGVRDYLSRVTDSRSPRIGAERIEMRRDKQ